MSIPSCLVQLGWFAIICLMLLYVIYNLLYCFFFWQFLFLPYQDLVVCLSIFIIVCVWCTVLSNTGCVASSYVHQPPSVGSFSSLFSCYWSKSSLRKWLLSILTEPVSTNICSACRCWCSLSWWRSLFVLSVMVPWAPITLGTTLPLLHCIYIKPSTLQELIIFPHFFLSSLL